MRGLPLGRRAGRRHRDRRHLRSSSIRRARRMEKRIARRHGRGAAGRKPAAQPQPARGGARYRGGRGEGRGGGRARRSDAERRLSVLPQSERLQRDLRSRSTQSFPLWGKRDLRRQAALADTAAARGREQSTRDRERRADQGRLRAVLRGQPPDRGQPEHRSACARRMNAAAECPLRTGRRQPGRHHSGAQRRDDGEDRDRAARGRTETPSAPASTRSSPGRLMPRLRSRSRLPVRGTADPALSLPSGACARRQSGFIGGQCGDRAARARQTLADKAWYPDLTIGAGPLIQTNHQPVGVAATIGFNIPVPWGREASQQREAAAQLSATQQRYDAAWLNIQGDWPRPWRGCRPRATRKLCCARQALPQARATIAVAARRLRPGQGRSRGADRRRTPRCTMSNFCCSKPNSTSRSSWRRSSVLSEARYEAPHLASGAAAARWLRSARMPPSLRARRSTTRTPAARPSMPPGPKQTPDGRDYVPVFEDRARGEHAAPLPRRAPSAASSITAIRWACRTPRRCRKKIRWAWITCPSMPTRRAMRAARAHQPRPHADARRAHRGSGDAPCPHPHHSRDRRSAIR